MKNYQRRAGSEHRFEAATPRTDESRDRKQRDQLPAESVRQVTERMIKEHRPALDWLADR